MLKLLFHVIDFPHMHLDHSLLVSMGEVRSMKLHYFMKKSRFLLKLLSVCDQKKSRYWLLLIHRNWKGVSYSFLKYVLLRIKS